jgi:phage gp29-like protein
MILDRNGNPIEEQAAQLVAGRTLSFTQSDRCGGPASELTPERVQAIMDAADAGDPRGLMAAAMDVIEGNWDVRQALQTRQNAVSGTSYSVQPGDESPEAKVAAERLKNAIQGHLKSRGLVGFRQLLEFLVPACITGFAIAETVWKPGGSGWHGWLPVPPASFTFYGGSREPLLVTEGNPQGEPLDPPGKWIVHTDPGPSGDLARGNLIRTLAWLHCFQHYGIKDWVSFTERYGMPFILMRVDGSQYDKEKGRLVRLIQAFGPNGGGVVSKAVEAQIIESAKSSSVEAYKALYDLCRLAIERLILGQNASSGASTGLSGGDAQSQVRQDIRERDCRMIEETLFSDLTIPWNTFCNPPGTPAPRIVFDCEPAADKKALADTLASLASAGLEADDPAEISAIMGVKLRRKPVAATVPGPGQALALAADSLASWDKPIRDFFAALEQKAGDSKISDADLLAWIDAEIKRIPALYQKMNVGAVAAMLQGGMERAAIAGALKSNG